MLSSARRLRGRAAGALRAAVTNELVRPLIEPILHPSRWRIRALGLSTTVGHPLFYLFWAKLLPQPYEHAGLRLLMGAMGLFLLLYQPFSSNPPSKRSAVLFTLIFWITLPVFFSWMYLCNGGNAVWLASMSAMFLIYYHLTDWRIATLGSVSGGAVAWLAFRAFGPVLPPFCTSVPSGAVIAWQDLHFLKVSSPLDASASAKAGTARARARTGSKCFSMGFPFRFAGWVIGTRDTTRP